MESDESPGEPDLWAEIVQAILTVTGTAPMRTNRGLRGQSRPSRSFMYGETTRLSTSIRRDPRQSRGSGRDSPDVKWSSAFHIMRGAESEPETRRGAADVRQDCVHVPVARHVVKNAEAKKYRVTHRNGGKPGETPPFDFLLDTDLYSVQPRAHDRRGHRPRRHPA